MVLSTEFLRRSGPLPSEAVFAQSVSLVQARALAPSAPSAGLALPRDGLVPRNRQPAGASA